MTDRKGQTFKTPLQKKEKKHHKTIDTCK